MQVWWTRRDLRLSDNPALLGSASRGGEVVALFVVDPTLWRAAGPARRAWLSASLRALDDDLGGRLVVRDGDPIEVVPAVAAEVGADGVHVSADAGPYGRRRDAAVAERLSATGRRLVGTGTPYAIGPGLLRAGSGRPYAVFTPFYRAWLRHGAPAPAPRPDGVRWAAGAGSQPLPTGASIADRGPHRDRDHARPSHEPEPDHPDDVPALPPAGERAALATWQTFLRERLADYGAARELPGVDGTSGLSAQLKFGEIHPRTLLADLGTVTGRGPTAGAEAFRRALAWREFSADQLWHRCDAARADLLPNLTGLRWDSPGDRLAAWQQGRTGYPLVDAGMRQLLAEGWMHNRVRMVAASFLIKDLHLPWQLGARWFMWRLRDGDLASNSLNWQWVAGSGSDAAPYFRIFNPVSQGLRFDPDGDYVRRYVPELAHLPGTSAHTPWDTLDGYAHGYPERIVDHATERAEALARLAERRRG